MPCESLPTCSVPTFLLKATTAMASPYVIICIVSNTVLFILLSLNIQQFCATNITDKEQVKRMILVLANLCCFCAANASWNFSYFMPTSTSQSISTIFEGLAAIIGFRTFRILQLHVMDELSRISGADRPCLDFALTMLQILFIIAALLCYSMYFIWPTIQWIWIFYCCFNVIVFLKAFYMLIALSKLIPIFKRINDDSVKAAFRLLKISRIVSVIICVATSSNMFICVNVFVHYIDIPILNNLTLILAIVRPAMVVFLSLALTLWIIDVRKIGCCVIYQESICAVYCCRVQFNERQNDNDNVAILLQDSTTENEHGNIVQRDNIPSLTEQTSIIGNIQVNTNKYGEKSSTTANKSSNKKGEISVIGNVHVTNKR